jgi:hypothetical protein
LARQYGVADEVLCATTQETRLPSLHRVALDALSVPSSLGVRGVAPWVSLWRAGVTPHLLRIV